MKKVSKYFAVSELFPIFALAILEKTGGNALFDILHDRLTSFDLVKTGKFNPIEVKSSLVKSVLYPDKGTDCLTIFVTSGISRTLLGKYVERTCPSFLLLICET